MLLPPSAIKRITFRCYPPDRATIGHPGTAIKVNGRECGVIVENPCWGGNPTGDNRFAVRLQVGVTQRVPDDPRSWEWVTVKTRFDTEPEARAYVTRDKLVAMLESIKDKPYKGGPVAYTGELWVDDTA